MRNLSKLIPPRTFWHCSFKLLNPLEERVQLVCPVAPAAQAGVRTERIIEEMNHAMTLFREGGDILAFQAICFVVLGQTELAGIEALNLAGRREVLV